MFAIIDTLTNINTKNTSESHSELFLKSFPLIYSDIFTPTLLLVFVKNVFAISTHAFTKYTSIRRLPADEDDHRRYIVISVVHALAKQGIHFPKAFEYPFVDNHLHSNQSFLRWLQRHQQNQ